MEQDAYDAILAARALARTILIVSALLTLVLYLWAIGQSESRSTIRASGVMRFTCPHCREQTYMDARHFSFMPTASNTPETRHRGASLHAVRSRETTENTSPDK
jgi:hypothetical protein